MVKMGRLVKDERGIPHFGCVDHRLEKTAERFYKHAGVEASLSRAKAVVTFIHKSSQVTGSGDHTHAFARSLVIPMVEVIRKGLNEVNERLQQLGVNIGTQQLEDGKDFNMESILSTMIQDLENRWGDGMDITKYSCRLGTNRGQPCGYTKEQILSFTLDPRSRSTKKRQCVKSWKTDAKS